MPTVNIVLLIVLVGTLIVGFINSLMLRGVRKDRDKYQGRCDIRREELVLINRNLDATKIQLDESRETVTCLLDEVKLLKEDYANLQASNSATRKKLGIANECIKQITQIVRGA